MSYAASAINSVIFISRIIDPDESSVSLTVRSCALDSGTLTTDSELIRMSHCGGFYYEDK